MLETDRLYLRKFIPEDSAHIYHLNNDPEVIKFTGDTSFSSLEEASNFMKSYISEVYNHAAKNNSFLLGRYAVIRKKDNEFLGWCGLKYHPEKRVIDVGFRFYRCYWGNGYATESAMSWIDYAFAKAKLPFLVAHSHIENIASQKVLERCGMQRQEEVVYDNQPTYTYSIQNPAYELKEISAKETWPVRHPVLRAGRPLEDVYMEADEKESTFHLGMFFKNNIVGVASFMEDAHQEFSGKQHRLRGMAVLPDYRKRGIAELILKEGESLLRKRGTSLLWFNARIIAVSFYKNLGYEVVGSEFDIPLVGPHYRMKKTL